MENIVVDNLSNVFGETEICEVNADAFISDITSNLVFKPSVRIQLQFSPDFGNVIRRSGYGFITIDGVKKDIKNIPHTLFCTASGNAELKTYILFPRLEASSDSRTNFLGTENQEKFIDKLLYPALKQSLFPSVLNRLPRSYKESISRGIGHLGLSFISSADAELVIDTMGDIIKSVPELYQFGGFKFITVAFGFKEEFENKHTILESCLDWGIIDKSKTHVDIAVNIYNFNSSIDTISFLNKARCKSFVEKLVPAKNIKFYPQAMGSFGGFSITKVANNNHGIKKLIAYSDMKYRFDLAKKTGFVDADGLWDPTRIMFYPHKKQQDLLVSSTWLVFSV